MNYLISSNQQLLVYVFTYQRTLTFAWFTSFFRKQLRLGTSIPFQFAFNVKQHVVVETKVHCETVFVQKKMKNKIEKHNVHWLPHKFLEWINRTNKTKSLFFEQNSEWLPEIWSTIRGQGHSQHTMHTIEKIRWCQELHCKTHYVFLVNLIKRTEWN